MHSSKLSKPKVAKYIQDLSGTFSKLKQISWEASNDRDVTYWMAEHELDGQTYILKKRRLFISNEEEIKDHPAYQEIIEVKDNQLPLSVRYINSWVERDKDFTDESKWQLENGLNVVLVIQMRHVDNFVKLAHDAILTNPAYQDLDAEAAEDLAEDTIEDVKSLTLQGVSFRDAILKSFSKIGCLPQEAPQGLEQTVWRICFNDTLSKS